MHISTPNTRLEECVDGPNIRSVSIANHVAEKIESTLQRDCKEQLQDDDRISGRNKQRTTGGGMLKFPPSIFPLSPEP